jgi:glycosyltransferase involved in cell wall biosynthesis
MGRTLLNPLAYPAGAHRRLVEAVAEMRPDVVDFQHSYTYVQTGLPDVCTFHNVESQLQSDLGVSGIRLNSVRRLEARVLSSARVVVAFSSLDEERLRELGPSRNAIHVVPLGYRPPNIETRRSQRESVRIGLFIGSMDYEPNREAARTLVALWPRLEAEAGLERLIVVGRGADSAITPVPGVEVYSDVRAVGPFLEQADVALIPLVTGGGVRVKLIEAFAVGLPVISTPVAAEGLEIEPGLHAAIVEEVDAFPEALRRVAPRSVRESLAKRAREVWASVYSPEAMADGMIRAYEDACR